ncbi:flagellar hook-basal body complex protein FliE [Tistlia consotensis]|uniref:Flagellar hook-basal body complex protein FliE n=2 Tax=Tistlia TaxID=1321364 RepID=A0A1Y6CPW6_9PROT|nr:flagellar hook-basal body complex protein FliE [Tistlia consotensis]SMF68160.1 flagellar hook-basal body complex protein FliE [Tistlia consotensis USBA 355]SNR98937.1 flagellar hook-basal body complex protein FliE [Tistlia consotensis]
MAINLNHAAQAYARAAGQAVSGPTQVSGLDARSGKLDDGFSAALERAVTGGINQMKQGEQQSMLAATGQADLNDVVVAVSKAELTLQTMTTLRDKAIQAYQDILRMPI